MAERAVLVVPVLPAAEGNGLAMRAGLLLEGLARVFEVDVVVVPAFGAPARTSPFVSERASTVCVLEAREPDPATEMVRRLSTPAARGRAEALHPLPALGRLAATRAAAQRVAAAADGAELVFVMRTYLAPVLDGLLDAAARPPIVLDVDDLESDTQRALGRPEEAERLERLERFYLPLVERVSCCSAEDGAALSARHRLREPAVVPNAVRVPADVPAGVGRHDLVLVGTLSYEPNAQAARWLIEAVLPLLGDDVRIAVVGRGPSAELRALADDERIVVAADVPDVSPWYARSRLAVVPVLRGGGTHVKLIEALAHGLPVVATSVGARGLPWPAAPDPVLIGDSAEEFAAGCRALLGDPGRAAELGRQGRELVSRHASVEVVAPAIASLSANVASGP